MMIYFDIIQHDEKDKLENALDKEWILRRRNDLT